MLFQRALCAFYIIGRQNKTCFILAVSRVLSWGFITKFSKQKNYREAGDIHKRKKKIYSTGK